MIHRPENSKAARPASCLRPDAARRLPCSSALVSRCGSSLPSRPEPRGRRSIAAAQRPFCRCVAMARRVTREHPPRQQRHTNCEPPYSHSSRNREPSALGGLLNLGKGLTSVCRNGEWVRFPAPDGGRFMNRRTLLGLVVQGGGAAAAGVVGVPAVMTALSPMITARKGEAWRSIARLETFPVGQVSEGLVDPSRETWPPAVSPQAVYVWRPSEEDVVVFSRSCTDLGCPVTFDEGSECFLCPCHGGIFDKNGERMAGPPYRPLYRYRVRIRDGDIQVDLNSLPPMT